MRESVDPAFYPWVVVECVAIKAAELQDVILQGGASKWRGHVGLDKGGSLEGHQALKTLDEKHHVPVIDIVVYQYYLTFFVGYIKLGVKVPQVGLVSSLCGGFW